MILCKRAIDEMRHLPEDEWDITVAGLPVYWLFPNVILMPFEIGVFLVRALPDRNDPGRHTSKVDFYIRQAKLGQAQENLGTANLTEIAKEIASTFSRIIRDEDYAMSCSQQACANGSALEQTSLVETNRPCTTITRPIAACWGMQIRSRLVKPSWLTSANHAIGHHATARPSSANSADVETRSRVTAAM